MTFDAKPDAVTAASRGAATTSGGGGSCCTGVCAPMALDASTARAAANATGRNLRAVIARECTRLVKAPRRRAIEWRDCRAEARSCMDEWLSGWDLTPGIVSVW